MPKPTKKRTKTATKKASPKRVIKSKKMGGSQLEVMLQARDSFTRDKIEVLGDIDAPIPGFISTQSLALDWIVGNGGVPMGRIIDVSGDKGIGKSSFGDQLMSEIQRLGGHCYLWDVENARDPKYQKTIGIARENAGKILSETMEDGFECMIDLIRWHAETDPDRPGVIVWDTPAATPTRAEIDTEKKDERFGPAKIIRGYLRKLNKELQKSRWILCVINQTYQGQSMSGQSFKAVYGGGGIPYYSSVSLSFDYPGALFRASKDKEMRIPSIGQTIWAKCTKNRVSPPMRSRKIALIYGQGFDDSYELMETLSASGLIKQSGSWKSFDPDGLPEAAALYPGSWQGSMHDFSNVIRSTPGLLGVLVAAYREVMDARDRYCSDVRRLISTEVVKEAKSDG